MTEFGTTIFEISCSFKTGRRVREEKNYEAEKVENLKLASDSVSHRILAES
jgi:hypothetical protein